MPYRLTTPEAPSATLSEVFDLLEQQVRLSILEGETHEVGVVVKTTGVHTDREMGLGIEIVDYANPTREVIFRANENFTVEIILKEDVESSRSSGKKITVTERDNYMGNKFLGSKIRSVFKELSSLLQEKEREADHIRERTQELIDRAPRVFADADAALALVRGSQTHKGR